MFSQSCVPGYIRACLFATGPVSEKLGKLAGSPVLDPSGSQLSGDSEGTRLGLSIDVDGEIALVTRTSEGTRLALSIVAGLMAKSVFQPENICQARGCTRYKRIFSPAIREI